MAWQLPAPSSWTFKPRDKWKGTSHPMEAQNYLSHGALCRKGDWIGNSFMDFETSHISVLDVGQTQLNRLSIEIYQIYGLNEVRHI